MQLPAWSSQSHRVCVRRGTGLRCHARLATGQVFFLTLNGDMHMKWSKPQYQDLRFGFEITMYISAR